MLGISLAVWAIFCPIAAAMAFLITYEEHRRRFPDRRRAVREALITAAFTLAVFLVLAVVAGLLVPQLTG